MFTKVLDCPKCSHRFGYDSDFENQLPEKITCPSCGVASPAAEYSALTFCSQCHSKLKVPLDLLSDEGLTCPKCGGALDLNDTFFDNKNNLTYAPENSNREFKRMLRDNEFFDKYKIIRLLGKGGMAEVYLAEHLLLKQQCAVKVMQKGIASDNPIFVKRFLREAQLTHSIAHPNIVSVFDAGSDFRTGYLFLAMEYVEGTNLSDLIKQNPLSEKELFDILTAMTGALEELHRHKIVHRDIKPSNIMKTTDGVYKLMDLGIAKTESDHQHGEMTLTMEQTSIGTPAYASPEQCQSAHSADIRSDIYCLGATIYHLASGKLPFAGATPVETILKVMQEEPAPLEKLCPTLSEKLLSLVRVMMKKNPDERPATPQDLLNLINGTDKIKEKKSEICNKVVAFVKKHRTTIIKAVVILIPLLYLEYHYRPLRNLLDNGKNVRVPVEKKEENTDKKVKKEPEKPKVIPQKRRFVSTPAIDGQLNFVMSEKFYGPEYSGRIVPQMVKNGVLVMDGVHPHRAGNHPVKLTILSNSISVPEMDLDKFTFSADYYMEPDNKGLFVSMGYSSFALRLFPENGKLFIKNRGRKYATGFEIPVNRWFNLTMSYNAANKTLVLFTRTKFIGSYVIGDFSYSTKSIHFYGSDVSTAFKGKVDDIFIYNGVKVPPADKNVYTVPKTSTPVKQTAAAPVVRPVPESKTNPVKKVPPVITEWQKGPDSTWFIRYEEAMKSVASSGKYLLVLFVNSSDFGKIEFKQIVDRMVEHVQTNYRDKVVKLYIDIPAQGRNLPADQYNYNRNLYRTLVDNYYNGYTGRLSRLPAIVLMPPDLKNKYVVSNVVPYTLSALLKQKLQKSEISGRTPTVRQNKSAVSPAASPSPVIRKKAYITDDPIVPHTIADRYKECEERLRDLQSQPTSVLNRGKINFIKKQMKELTRHQRAYNKMQSAREGKYFFQDTRKLEEAVNDFVKSQYSNREKKIEKIIELLEKDNVDPNIVFQSSNHEMKHISYLLSYVYSKQQQDLVKVFKKRYCDLNRLTSAELAEKCDFEGIAQIDIFTQPRCRTIFFLAHKYKLSHFFNVGGTFNYEPLKKFLLLAPTINGVKDSAGRTLMHYAVEHNNKDMVVDLVYAGFSDGKIRDDKGLTPYQYAVRFNFTDMIRLLEQAHFETPLTEKDRLQQKFVIALHEKNYAMIEKYLKDGADPYEAPMFGLNALQYACNINDIKMVRLLLERGVDPNRYSMEYSASFRSHPLQIAIIKGNFDIFSLLLDYRISMNPPRGYRISFAYYIYIQSMRQKNTEQILKYYKKMLAHGWDLNRGEDSFFYRMLLQNSRKNISIPILKFLLENGLDPERYNLHKVTQDPEIKELIDEAIRKRKGL